MVVKYRWKPVFEIIWESAEGVLSLFKRKHKTPAQLFKKKKVPFTVLHMISTCYVI